MGVFEVIIHSKKSILYDLSDAVKKFFNELTVFGKMILGPIVVLIFIVITISVIMVGYPFIVLKEKYSKQIENGTNKIKQLFFQDT